MPHSGIVASTHFSTTALPGGEQFAAWRECISVIFDVTSRARQAARGFAASLDAFQAGDILMAVSEYDAQRCRRTTQRINRDQIDHFVLSFYQSGGWACDNGGTASICGRAGQIRLIDLAQPLVSDEPRCSVLHMFVPRHLLEDRVPTVSSLHGRALRGPCADLLADHMQLLSRRLPQMPASAGVHLGRAALDIIIACLQTAVEPCDGVRPNALLVRRAKRFIDSEIGSPDLTVDSIAAHIGVSRRALYRIFEPWGGVGKHIRNRRLERIHAELCDHRRRRRIADIAAEHGFSRADHFSRAFRHHFGYAPAQARAMPVRGATHPAQMIGQTFDKWISELGA